MCYSLHGMQELWIGSFPAIWTLATLTVYIPALSPLLHHIQHFLMTTSQCWTRQNLIQLEVAWCDWKLGNISLDNWFPNDNTMHQVLLFPITSSTQHLLTTNQQSPINKNCANCWLQPLDPDDHWLKWHQLSAAHQGESMLYLPNSWQHQQCTHHSSSSWPNYVLYLGLGTFLF